MKSNEIGVMKSILWEEAKGKLRAFAIACVRDNKDDGIFSDWIAIDKKIKKFIEKIEEEET